MTEVKTFKIVGEVRKPNLLQPMRFTKTIEAAKKEHALEKIYAEIGSCHRAKRYNIKILSVQELEKAEEPSKIKGG